jgi:hypothetical protein
VSPEQLLGHSRRIYHLTPTAHVDSIRRYGLLSTSALLERFQVPREERDRLEGARRGKPEPLTHPKWGSVQLRDQHPLSVRALERALGGSMSVEAWLRMINGKVFFFPDEDRLNRLATAYQHEAQSILVIDTARLLERHVHDTEVSHMNTGATAPFAHPRGPETFKPLRDYPYDERGRRRGRADALAEVTVRWAVPDVESCLVDVVAVAACPTVTNARVPSARVRAHDRARYLR